METAPQPSEHPARAIERLEWRPDPSLEYGTGGLTPEARKMTWAQIRDLAMTR